MKSALIGVCWIFITVCRLHPSLYKLEERLRDTKTSCSAFHVFDCSVDEWLLHCGILKVQTVIWHYDPSDS